MFAQRKSARACVRVFYVFIHSLRIHTVTHAHCGFSQVVRLPTAHTHTHKFAHVHTHTHILGAGGSVAMATGRTAASAAAATEAEPDETEGWRR